ncbi:hypothetical protein QQS21_000786 [Conoideocrella luteorostrata]|uniref:Zn(2)-C6 fungal-type domain-containing protein n=1 Tax=Conoideocrella luteorostrata TaxID=1105319 RepID=A0AAJ0CYG8_9HYPO|nr:hypothetical protein QQS21_000786 [Conoideocrella luteorostrata]
MASKIPAPGVQAGVQQERKRKRPVVSCIECHSRKQKCDRSQPCSNCSKREKVHLCTYEHPFAKASSDWFLPETNHDLTTASTNFSALSLSPASKAIDEAISEDLGYSKSSTTGTLGMIRKIGGTSNSCELPLNSSSSRPVLENYETASHYRALIRQLPAKRYRDPLVRMFFTDVAWHYDIVDEAVFRDLEKTWSLISYASFPQYQTALPANTRFFPALFFQVLAQGLLFQPLHNESMLDDLKYAPDMSFADLASEYSDIGDQICRTLGKRDMSIVKIQAGLLRTSFLKSTGSVVEAWHTLGSTIKDAEEIGLHRVCSIQEEEVYPFVAYPIEQQWDVSLRRKLWLALHLWDSHMAVVLERPMSTKIQPAVPLTLKYISHGRTTSIYQFDGEDSHTPTPFGIILHGYDAAYKYLQDIHDMESSIVNRDQYDRVERIHSEISVNIQNLPDWARIENTNREYDKAPGYQWLPASREILVTEVNFTLLALHRPHIFAHRSSRNKALQAGLAILESQNRLFNMAEPRQYGVFNFVFTTFDAMALIAALFIAFPEENLEQLVSSTQAIERGLARLESIRLQNKLAATAHATIQELYTKLTKIMVSAIMNYDDQPATSLSALTGPQTCITPAAHDAFSAFVPPTCEAGLADSMPLPLGFSTSVPLQSFHDLVFQQLPSLDGPKHSDNVSPHETVLGSLGGDSRNQNLWGLEENSHNEEP